MSMAHTLIRCRMRDLISCFNARKVLTKEDIEESVHQTPNASSNNKQAMQVEHGALTEKDDGGVGQESPTSWKSCDSDQEEDEYIVFCFKDDEPRVDANSSWRKQNAVGDKNHKESEIQEIQVDSKLIASKSSNERNKCKQQEHKEILEESSDSSSTSSFAFPTMQREWTGSPVLMPRPEGQNKARSVCVQCCKF